MLNQLKNKLINAYSKSDLQVLNKIESILTFDNFNSKVALKLGELIVEIAGEDRNEVAIIIIRESDKACIFQYIGEGKSQRNIDFAMKKRNTVIYTKHSSLWAMVKEVVDGGLNDVFNVENECLPVGGAFPIIVNGELVATVAVSGLKNGEDHLLIIKALCRYLKKEIPEFSAPLI